MTSPYHNSAANLRDNGYRAIPIGPGTKIPGHVDAGEWRPMPGWTKYCDAMPPEFLHGQWERLPDAGVGVAHGNIVGLDLDTDDKDIEKALHRAVEPSEVRRRGSKGWMGYYRPGPGLENLTRVRWYDDDGVICVELLLHGTQSVLPPSIHPDTNRPYTWILESLEDTDISDLPELTGADLEALDREFGKIGLTQKAPRRVGKEDYPCRTATDHDLEKPFGRSLNDRALEPEALGQWWPALGLPKTRQRNVGSWEGVPYWRPSNSGRPVQDRNPNLKAAPTGIVDFGADRSYTPIDVVMAARDCSFQSAADWLGQFVRAEDIQDMSGITAPVAAEPSSEPVPFVSDRWATTPVFAGSRSWSTIKPISLPSDEEWDVMVPKEPPAFPIQSFDVCEGLLGEVASHLDAASATATEAGALAVSLPLLGAVMGRSYATPTNLRTNIYCVALGGSGTGKTSLVNPAKELMTLGQVSDLIGQDRIASGSGLLRMLSGAPRRVCFLDEFGHMLQQIGLFGAGVHAKQIITEFTALYSGANTLFTGTAYATQEPTPIDCPNLCIFGMATPEQFWRAFGSSSLEDGSIARYLVFPLGQTAPKDIDASAADDVATSIRNLQASISGRVTGNIGNSAVKVAPLLEPAEAVVQALKQKETAFAEYAELNGIRGGSAILRRVTENALKIALISAVGRNVDEPEIDQRDMEIGHALAWWSANVMISNIASYVADNQTERDVNDVERFIAGSGEMGRQWRDIQRRFRRIKQRDLRDILEGLEREETVRMEHIPSPSGGHGVKVYRSA